jgi:hypothetical protein
VTPATVSQRARAAGETRYLWRERERERERERDA